MISRAHMRRQLRANGGITNLRQGYGLGDFVRKLIPNELADLASKAAPFVAPFNPLAAGIMRGVGRYDKRGSLKDALKQGVLTYAGGQGARMLGGAGRQGLQNPFSREAFKSPIGADSPLKSLIPEKTTSTSADKKKSFFDRAKAIIDDPSKTGIEKTKGVFGELNPVTQGQLITGGGTFIATLIGEALKDEPEQQPGETIEEYNARRKQKVSSYLRTYLSNTRPTASTEEIDTLVERYTSEYNQGGRVGYQTGGISMTNTLAQNRAINNARRAANQDVLQQARQRLSAQRMNQNLPTGLDRINVTNMANRIRNENLDQATGGARGVAAIVTGPPTQDDISAAINANSFIKANPNYYVRDRGGATGIPRGPNGGYIIDGVEYFSEQEAIDAMGMDRYTQVMSKGGRVGLAEGTNELMKRIEELMDEGLDYGAARAQAEREMSSKNMGGIMRTGLAMGTQLMASAPDPMDERNSVMEMMSEKYYGRPLKDLTDEEIIEIEEMMNEMDPYGKKPTAPNIRMASNAQNDAILERLYEKYLEMGLSPKAAADAARREMERMQDDFTSAPEGIRSTMAAQGGRIGYAIGSPDKQLEAGAPPIMYSGNMDPNQKTGLPSIPGPIQMAEDGPEFDMRENGGFQPLGRQEGKDDVPAMLAKNEFVMTADAVRAAGGGSIEKGAQKMYDTMKKLESRVS